MSSYIAMHAHIRYKVASVTRNWKESKWYRTIRYYQTCKQQKESHARARAPDRLFGLGGLGLLGRAEEVSLHKELHKQVQIRGVDDAAHHQVVELHIT